ncbi:hypothetical protein [Variovorax sp. DXTD-1]|uniref:hypothetical protein n=1 Tax=Variovorax sp. DXTD-1 TaxID=2495592 RepID=UPI000F8869E0|nr:hypothetical protein [Variovorax sp. DXTD-1]RST54090.1 hypothetical protein EJI00_02895 [Variovorax sp. DXTD-1]
MSDFYASSGILAKVPGDVIGATSMSLPKPGPGQPPERFAEVDHHLGRVRITYKLSSTTHHKSTNWYWKAVFAELVEGG